MAASKPGLGRALALPPGPEPDGLQRRLFEVAVSVLGLAILGPLMALVGLLIKLEAPGPVFFIQKRVGRGEKLFDVIKFRSMRQPEPGEQTLPEIEDIESFVFRPPNLRKRATVIGRTIRACSLDELPNLLNVIRGDMHLVGPRPDEPEIVAQYRPEYHRRHSVKPGLTGLAQVNGRADLTYQEIMAYDLAYADFHPFRRDVEILLKSIGVVFRGEGAR